MGSLCQLEKPEIGGTTNRGERLVPARLLAASADLEDARDCAVEAGNVARLIDRRSVVLMAATCTPEPSAGRH
jgi:hypothetical protein